MSRLKVLKRDGVTQEDFDLSKIRNAIYKAMVAAGSGTEYNALCIATKIEKEICKSSKELIDIKAIEDLVHKFLCEEGFQYVAQRYEGYRAIQEYKRFHNPLDEDILGIINGSNEKELSENSNKKGQNAATQRDLMAGQYSRDWTRRCFLPHDILEAHDEGIIHFHDSDYQVQHIFNCCLVDLKDMLGNGTVINDHMIETPKSFRTACTVTTQISQQIANGQYGGHTWAIAHLSPYLRVSRNKIKNAKREEWDTHNFQYTEAELDAAVMVDLKKELADGVQTIQYQVSTFATSNGQTPFLTIFMDINQEPEYREETVMICEEMLRQRILGLKNVKGIYVSPSFPKLIYVLDENNMYEDSEYFWLTKLAAECTAKRMVPDYISAKNMRKNYEGNVFGPMGCVDGNEIITYKFKDSLYVESFKRMWDRLSNFFEQLPQYAKAGNPNLYMDTDNKVQIYDTEKGFVNCKRLIRNISDNWAEVKMTNGRMLKCTSDHPWATERGRIFTKDLVPGDKIKINHFQYTGTNFKQWDNDISWAYGVLLCDSATSSGVTASLGFDEEDIVNELKRIVCSKYNIQAEDKKQHRGKKGNYIDVRFQPSSLQYDLIKYFEGVQKKERHIPNIVFSMNEEARIHFLAGMIDADGYVNSSSSLNKIQLGSTNKELALQQAALAQSLRMPAFVYPNHYSSKHPERIRYRVEFVPSDLLISTLKCSKKKELFTNNIRKNDSVNITEISEIISVTQLNETGYSYDVTTDSDHFEVSGIYSHNCRSFLSPWKDENGEYKFWGRFNQGVVTINLADVALSAKEDVNAINDKDMERFWNILENRLDLCKRTLLLRHEYLEGTGTNVSPIHFRHGAIARLGENDTIDSLLHGGYSTLSLGYAALYECVLALTGESHTSPKGEKLARDIMSCLRKHCDKWKKEENIGFALYGTPLENTTYKFAKTLKKRFGVIKGITDRDYVTNSYHVFVQEEITAFDKLKFESQFQDISSGGCISYIETHDMQGNINAVLSVIKFIYDYMVYAELNSKHDYCHVCGYEGEILIDENGEWYCPYCGNRDHEKMNVIRRTCGYLGENFWNKGRTKEIKDRVMHL